MPLRDKFKPRTKRKRDSKKRTSVQLTLLVRHVGRQVIAFTRSSVRR